MREHLARFVCALSLALVIALAWVFAVRHNPRSPAPSPPLLPVGKANRNAGGTSPVQITRGQVLFRELDCATCHSFRGQGNPRRPLDDSGARLSREELAAWITGTGVATSKLSPGALKRKQSYQALPPEDLAALVALLTSPSLDGREPRH